MATLAGLMAVGPLVVAGRVDERILECGPEIEDLAIVGFGAELLAGVDVADVEHEIDLRVGVDRGDEASVLSVWLVSVGFSPYGESP